MIQDLPQTPQALQVAPRTPRITSQVASQGWVESS